MQIKQLYSQKFPCICDYVFSRNRPLKLVFTNLEPKDVSEMKRIAKRILERLGIKTSSSFDQKYKFSNKNDMVSAWRNFKNIFPSVKQNKI